VRTWARAIGAGLLATCALVGFAAAFALSATAGADPGQTVTTTDPPTTTEPPPTEPPIEPPPPPTPAPIAFGVTVGGVKVGGLLPARATEVVQKAFVRPLVLVVSPTRKIHLRPSTLGARSNVPKAVRRARVARPGASVPLDVEVSRARVRTYVDRLGKSLDVVPVDARLVFEGVKPRAIESQEGRRLRRLAGSRDVRYALQRNTRTPIRLAFDTLKPKVESIELGTAVVILRDSNRLLYFVDAKFVRWFGVATGRSEYPTPIGNFEIVNMQRNPWWYPPPSKWAADSEPVPPGPGNPLGTRWMGLSAPYVGIHGTPDASSIGYSASHGCIRMRIPDAEWLFQHVKLGTPVFIIAR
jgi:L,D-transpeptidase catalytic domain/Putative peptidoglycan binding domain